MESPDTFFVYADIHNHVDSARFFLAKWKPRKVIWLGDFMDSFGDIPDNAARTALFIQKDIIEARPQDLICLSNHDLAYRFPDNAKYHPWGFTEGKYRAFLKHFELESWDRFKIYHKLVYRGQEIVFSHAGWRSDFFPFGIFDERHLERICPLAIAGGNQAAYNPVFDSPKGPLWTRWPLPALGGICQVVGHTPCERPRVAKNPGERQWNLCLDCAHTYAAKFSPDGVFAINLKQGTEQLIKDCVNEPFIPSESEKEANKKRLSGILLPPGFSR